LPHHPLYQHVRLQFKYLKKTLNILATNWVHLVGFYITAYLSIALFKLLGVPHYGSGSWIQTLLLSLVSIPFLFFTYGLKIIVGFFGVLVLLDLIGFRFTKFKIRTILLVEWLLIIPVFIGWAFEYEYWLWITLALSFLVTQYWREQKLKRIIVA
jgi:hypothetical protein